MDSTLRYVGGAVGFGFGAMWMTVGIGSAIACLLLAALGYGAVWVAERAQANADTSVHRPTIETFEADADLPLTADELEVEEMQYEEPEPSEHGRRPVPLAGEPDYGWPTG